MRARLRSLEQLIRFERPAAQGGKECVALLFRGHGPRGAETPAATFFAITLLKPVAVGVAIGMFYRIGLY